MLANTRKLHIVLGAACAAKDCIQFQLSNILPLGVSVDPCQHLFQGDEFHKQKAMKTVERLRGLGYGFV